MRKWIPSRTVYPGPGGALFSLVSTPSVEGAICEARELRSELGRLDAMCMALAAIVVLDTLGAVATGGAQAVVWLVVAALLFFVPAALVIAIFAALPRLRRGAEPPSGAFRIPGRRTPLVLSALATAWVAFATASMLWPGLGGDGAAALPAGFDGDRLAFSATVAAPLVATLAIGAVWYALGRRRPAAVAPSAA